MTMLPMIDNVTIVKIKGDKLHKVLENSVSSYPELAGKYPSISGCRLEFNPSLPSGARIDPNDIYIQGEQLDFNKEYTVSAKSFIVMGKDGYTDFIGWEQIIGEFEGIIMNSMLLEYLKMLEDREESETFNELWKIVGNEEKELSPEYEKDGKTYQCIMIKPQLDGRIKIKAS